jgi:RNA polymerase sigma-70 factor (ECF subfamily)
VATTGPNVGAARELDPAAVAAAYRSWAPALHRWLSVLLGDPGAAQALTGTVFADAVGRLDSFDGPDELLAAWPFLVARDHLPARRPRAAGRTGNARLDALWLLPAAEREVLLLRLVAGLSAAETGFATGRGTRAVQQLVHRGLARLAGLAEEGS